MRPDRLILFFLTIGLSISIFSGISAGVQYIYGERELQNLDSLRSLLRSSSDKLTNDSCTVVVTKVMKERNESIDNLHAVLMVVAAEKNDITRVELVVSIISGLLFAAIYFLRLKQK